MSASAPWSVKGIDPKAREAAKDAARRAGMTLGEWLNAVIIQGEGEEPDAAELAAGRKRALRGAVYGGVDRTEDELARLARALDALGDRVTATETTQALKLAGAGDRLERADAERRALGARVEALAERLADTERRHAAQIAGIKAEAATALRSLESGAMPDDAARAVAALAERVQAAERRSALAVERMGQQVLRVAENLHGRMSGLERTGLEAARTGREAAEAARAGLEVAEARLRRIEEGQEQLVDRLSSDVARLTERLSERLEGVERRAAVALDDVGERLGRQQSKLEARYERLAGEFDARIRASEERTRLLLDEARATLERSVADASERAALPVEPVEPEVPAFKPIELFEPEHGEVEAAPAPEPKTFAADDFDLPPHVTVRRPRLVAENEPETVTEPEPPLTVREAVDAGRSAARRGDRASASASAESFALGSLRLRKRANGRGRDAAPQPRRRESGAIGKVALASATAVTVVSAVAGWSMIFAGDDKAADPIAMSLTTTAPSPDQQAKLAADYAAAAAKLEAGDPAGVEALIRVAEAGHGPAQFHVGKLYETGQGVDRNDGEARRWTERAARGGEPRAMYNLAHYWFDGIGGEKDPGTASVWFRKAAKVGLTDAQFNLARLYEEGYGVPLNLAAAYEWYLIAARSGDPDSAAAAERLKAALTPEKQAQAERAAADFKATPVESVVTAAR